MTTAPTTTETDADAVVFATAAPSAPMLPYRKGGAIDYDGLEFDPHRKHLTPDAMEQNQEMVELRGLLAARFTDFNRRPDVFLDNETFICYEPSDRNIRVSPDLYLAFGVDAAAIRRRRIYLPDEAGKVPDWALEIASSSTAWADVNRKPGIYAAVGIAEYWRFDPGGRYHGAPLWGGRLVNGAYEPIPLTTEPDGVLKGYSAVLGVSICWDEGWPRLYDPATGQYDANWRQVAAALEAAEEGWASAEEAWATEVAARTIAESARDYAEAARANAESARANAEADRDKADAARANAESALDKAEAARANAESDRDKADAARANAESALDKSEAARADAEAEIAQLRELLRRMRESD